MSGTAGNALLSQKSLYLNAPAHECSHASARPGRHVIGYQDGEYHIIGFYFGHEVHGRRTLYYVLRSATCGEGLEAWEGTRQAAGARP